MGKKIHRDKIFYDNEKTKDNDVEKQAKEIKTAMGTKKNDQEIKLEMIASKCIATVELNKMKKQSRKKQKFGFVPYSTDPFLFMNYHMGGESGGIPEEDRSEFIQKVFVTLIIMLSITGGANFVIYNDENLRSLFNSPVGVILALIGLSLSLVAMCSIGCCACARMPPCNFFMALIMVIGLTLAVAHAICKYNVKIISHAFIATAAIVVICLLLSFTSIDFTKYLIYVVLALAALCVCSLAVFMIQIMTGVRMKGVEIAILFGQVIFMSFAFIIELQSVLGGKEVQLETDEWVAGAIILYSSIIMIFLKLLRLIGMLELDEDYSIGD